MRHRIIPTRARFAATLATALAALWLALHPALAHAQPGAAAPANTMCPVMTDEEIDPEISVEFEGKTVHLCCQKCRRKFETTPQEYLAHLPQFGGTPPFATPAAARAASGDDDDDDEKRASVGSSISLTERLGRFHVAAVHFPIALLCVAALVELLRHKRAPAGSESAAAFSVRLLTWLGAAGAILAMTLGLIHEESVESSLSGAAHETLELHELTGIAVAVAAALVAIALQARAAQPQTLVARLAGPLLYLVALATAFTAHLGGIITHGAGFLLPW